MKQEPSHTSGKLGGQPVGLGSGVSIETAATDNRGDRDDVGELIKSTVDLIVEDRLDVGVEVLEIDGQPAGAQTLKPFRV